MTTLLLTHHALSLLVVFACWWVAHEYARDEPPGRLIAFGWSLVGLAFLATTVIRHHTPGFGLDNLSWGALSIKASILFTEGCVIARLTRRRRARMSGDYGYPCCRED